MDELHLFVYGEIGGGLFSEGTTSESIQKEINSSNAKEIIVHISSPGGGVFEGWTIGNILKNSGKTTTAKIEGFCASIATYIALSCNRVEMAEVGRFLIHNPSLGLEGEKDDMEKAASQLESIKEDLINTYRNKTGLSSSQLSKMMDDETTLTAAEAKTLGFVDAFMTPIRAVARFDSKTINKKKMEKKTTEDSKAQELNGVLDKTIDKLSGIIKSIFTAQNITVSLEDGGELWVESEDGELEGKRVFSEEDGDVAEDGTYPLIDGRILTVEGGIVISVAEVAEDCCGDVLEKEKAIQELTAELSLAVKAQADIKKEASLKFNEIMAEVKQLKTMTAGSTSPPEKAIHEPTNKFEAQAATAHRLDAFAETLKRNR
tara:strand:- start:1028 stop:2152 length:1125 start_codon:yes stop_codon:yes gene_type:complete